MFAVVLNAVVGVGVEGHEGGDLQGVMVVELMRSLGVAVGPDARGTDGS